jgi:hypothetical protein
MLEESKVVVIKPFHLGLAFTLHLIVIIFTIGLFYGVMRTQIDDDRATIQQLVNSRDTIDRTLNDLTVKVGQLEGKIDTMVKMQASTGK